MLDEWLQVPQYQGGDLVTYRHLDLRQTITLLHLGNQLAQWHEHAAQMRRQHLTAVHVRHITRLAFMEPHQDDALLDHITDRQSRPVAVAPSRPRNRPEHLLRFDLAKMPQGIFNRALFAGHLGVDVQVLHLATTAISKVTALRLDTLRAFTAQRLQSGLFPIVFLAEHRHPHFFARQCTLNKYNFAFAVVGHALGV